MKMYVILKEYANEGVYEDYEFGQDIMIACSTSIAKARDFVGSILNTNKYTEASFVYDYEFKILDTELCGEDERCNELILARRKYYTDVDEAYQRECTFNETFYVREIEVIE